MVHTGLVMLDEEGKETVIDNHSTIDELKLMLISFIGRSGRYRLYDNGKMTEMICC